jgi:hypothetical protein
MKPTKLSKENFQAAKDVAIILKRYKAITMKDFRNHWCASRGWTNPWIYWHKQRGENYKSGGEYFSLTYNYNTTLRFLKEQEIMTIEKVKSHTFLVATQKLSRGKQFEKVFEK